ncbi:DUF4465 domain-containing protein [Myroides marinus]|uniref:DUF4465 domain-containing protein n=1 Tax=Myroides marinus TaxID=703342 RepID=UPI0025762DAA|nr:DUF4465 domain-containing protein [Myroides marinus]MDM1348895.1 DUF4465 domain-containing protein [Myroides marinus]MDM1352541.1 DUF4465 domain-containing protein [Myroides marinus]MDM1356110.1 DUF4465 domain-containing protein [Myroides marinus]MDM1359746.1 DUF4465 domain-containing protein [Myroides marinus]MDM1363282.1 DUF4465 domain-containing protein [Myroides marinus]
MKKQFLRLSTSFVLGLTLLTATTFTSCSSDDNSTIYQERTTLDLSSVPLTLDTKDGKIWKETFTENTPLAVSSFIFKHTVNTFGESKYWNGFTVSNSTDKTDHKDKFPTYMYGTMADNSAPFLVANTQGLPNGLKIGDPIKLDGANTVATLTDSTTPQSIELALSPYTYHSTERGDQFAKKFEKGDFFRVIIYGLDENNTVTTAPIEHYLIDYRKEKGNVNMNWQKVNLEKLGKVKHLVFYIDSSDKGQWGVNTPAYFTAKNLTVYKTN